MPTTTIRRAWKIQHEPFVNEGGKIAVETHAGLSPEKALGLQHRRDSGEFEVAVERVTTDVEDADRNVITEPDRTYQILSNGNEHYLIETD